MNMQSNLYLSIEDMKLTIIISIIIPKKQYDFHTYSKLCQIIYLLSYINFKNRLMMCLDKINLGKEIIIQLPLKIIYSLKFTLSK